MNKKIIFLCLALFIAGCTAKVTDANRPNQGNNKMNHPYGTMIDLKKNEKIRMEDGLSIVLHSFSHKRPFTGGATKATAYLSVSKDLITNELSLSIHGIDGKSQDEGGLSDAGRYDTEQWNGYEFQLRHFIYDQSIGIIVNRK